MPAKNSGRITTQTSLVPAMQAWESYLYDQGRSPNTVKAFLSDVRILTQFLPPDQTIGAVTTRDLDRFFRWMEKERDVPCSPKTLARWEKFGKIKKPKRDWRGWRVYEESDLEHIKEFHEAVFEE